MSFNVLRDNNLDITIALVKRVRENVNGKFVNRVETIQEIDLSAVVELEITDSLLHHGIVGRAILNNKFGVLDQLRLFANAEDHLFLSIEIIDQELAEANVPAEDRTITCLAMIEDAAAAAANIQDNLVSFKFEEAFIAEMKHTSWATFYINNFKSLKEFSVYDLVNVFANQVSDLYSSQQVAIKQKGLEAFEPGKSIKDTLEQLMKEGGNGQTVYDVFKALLERTTLRDEGDRLLVHHLPLFRFTNKVLTDPLGAIDSSFVNRTMEFGSCFTDRHREFIKEAAENGLQYESSVKAPGVKANNYYGDVYLEKFTVGPFAQLQGIVDPNTSWHNKIENFNIQRPDIFSLLKTDWVNYRYCDATYEYVNNIGGVKVYHILYARALNNFAINELGLNETVTGGVNLPMFNPKTMADAETVYRNSDFKLAGKGDQHPSNRQVENSLYYKLTRAFITLNETCQFESKGRIYRKPGKFIWIDENDYQNLAESFVVEGDISSLLTKLWFVNSVTHKIANGEYNTSIYANRFFGNRTVADIDVLLKEHKEYIEKQIKGGDDRSDWNNTLDEVQRKANNDVYGTDTPSGFTASNAFSS